MAYTDDIQGLSKYPLNIIELGFDTSITAGGTEYLCQGQQPFGTNYWPCVERIDWASTRSGRQGGLGDFGEVTVHCADFDWPYGDGTYFGRLLANNPYYLNRLLKIHVGFHKRGDTFTFNSTNFKERRYFIKKITGPDHNGKVKINAIDVLSLLKEAQVPSYSNGKLNASLNSTDTTTINITDNTGFSAGGGYAIINDEIIAYSGISGGDSITISARAQGGSEADSHDASDAVRVVYRSNQSAVDTIREIIEDFTDIDHATYIPDSDWNTEETDYLSATFDLWVKEPTETDKVIDSVAKQAYASVYWDDEDQEIKLKAIRSDAVPADAWNDDSNILKNDRIVIKRDQRQILTQVWVYYSKLDQSSGDSAENFENVYIQIDSVAEAALGEVKAKKVYANAITTLAGATRLANGLIAQQSRPIEMNFSVESKDSAVKVGDIVDIRTRLIQDTSGANQLVKLRVIERTPLMEGRYKYGLIYSGVEPGARYGYIAENSVPDYDSATDAQKAEYAFIADGTDKVSGDEPYLISL